MTQGLQQFIGEPVDIIYLDRNNKSTQRTVNILTIGNLCTVAYCMESQEPELLNNDNILAVMPIKKYLN